MRLIAVREFGEKATGLLRSKTPILVTRRGRLAGILFSRPEVTLPLELKRELYAVLTADVRRHLERRGVSPENRNGRAGKKRGLVVPLWPQAQRTFEDLRRTSGEDDWVFSSGPRANFSANFGRLGAALKKATGVEFRYA